MIEKEIKICSIEGCENISLSRKLCSKHYRHLWKSGLCNKNYCIRGKHRLTRSPEYVSWEKMKTRCYNVKNNRYRFYGARGITVCDRWKYSFENFLEDMGNKPAGYHIDRIDNNGNYEPSNCRWLSSQENCQNQSTTKLNPDKVREIRSSSLSNYELAEKFGVSMTCIHSALIYKTWKNVE